MRAFLALLLAVLFAVLVPFADLGAWAQRELVSTDSFVRLGELVVDASAVRTALADRVVGDLEAAVPSVAGRDATLRPLVAQVLTLPQLRPAFDDVLASTHDQLRDGHDPLQLDLAPLLPILREQLPSNLAPLVPSEVFVTPITVLRRSDAPVVWEAVQLVQDSALAFPIAAGVVLVLAVAVARRRGPMLILLGVITAVLGVGLIALVQPGRSLLENQQGRGADRAAFLSGYDTVVHSFVQQTVAVVVAGLVLVVVGGIVAWRAGGRRRPLHWA